MIRQGWKVYRGIRSLNYYVIDIDGKAALTAQSKKDKYEAMLRIASTMSPKAVVKKVNSLKSNLTKTGVMSYE
jgi:hypothetical protein